MTLCKQAIIDRTMKKPTHASTSSQAAGYKINPTLMGKYDDQPLFAEKLERANRILAKTGVPKF
jgi:hypothetical protein